MNHFKRYAPIALILGTLLWVGVNSVCAQEVGPADLTYLAEDYPPANYMENGQLKGASVELLKKIWEKMGVPEQPIKVVPWARGYNLVQQEKNTVLFTMSRNEAREKLFKWVGPIFKARHVLIGMADADIQINSLEDAKKYTIGTIREDIGETTLLEAGFDRDKLESVARLEQNMKKLMSGRVDLISQSEESVRDFIALRKYAPQKFKTFWVINERGNYYAFHKETPDALIQKFQTALDSLETERQEITARYNMTP